MLGQYHRAMTEEALEGKMSPETIQAVVTGNLYQDRLAGQFGHPEYHFDDNAFQAGYRFMELQKQIILSETSKNNIPTEAWLAFGRLTHAAQDFYAHSNYVRLWEKQFGAQTTKIDPLLTELLTHPDLRSGKIYQPFEWFSSNHGIGRWIKNRIPHDAHTWMNLDKPESGPLFFLAIEAATQRTAWEFSEMVKQLAETGGTDQVVRFTGI